MGWAWIRGRGQRYKHYSAYSVRATQKQTGKLENISGLCVRRAIFIQVKASSLSLVSSSFNIKLNHTVVAMYRFIYCRNRKNILVELKKCFKKKKNAIEHNSGFAESSSSALVWRLGYSIRYAFIAILQSHVFACGHVYICLCPWAGL